MMQNFTSDPVQQQQPKESSKTQVEPIITNSFRPSSGDLEFDDHQSHNLQ